MQNGETENTTWKYLGSIMAGDRIEMQISRSALLPFLPHSVSFLAAFVIKECESLMAVRHAFNQSQHSEAG